MQPTECKYCGCEEIATKTDSEIVFRCWSSYLSADALWTVSNNCGARCAVQLVELKGRVQRAVEVLEGARRYDFIDLDLIESWDAQKAVEILTGEQIHDAS